MKSVIKMSGIGLLNEKSLNASLKEWYAQPEDRSEVTVDEYVIDIPQLFFQNKLRHK